MAEKQSSYKEENDAPTHREATSSVRVSVRRVSQTAQRLPLPEYKTAGAAGVDLVAAVDEPVCLAPGERKLVPTGIAIALPSSDLAAFVFARSGLASEYGIRLSNGVGVIDSDYRGEILCPLYNGGQAPYVIEPGERIAQLVVMPVAHVRWHEVAELPPTDRGTGGFGSTGSGG